VIAVVDYGSSNLRSVHKALHRVGADAALVSSPSEVGTAEKIVLPGVAAFGSAMEQLRAQGLDEAIVAAIRGGVPFLGICLGLQFLFDVSYEQGRHTGLGVFPGKVVRFDFSASTVGHKLTVPHMGWNQLDLTRPCPLFDRVGPGAFAYFAHSYHVAPMEVDIVVSQTEFGYPFTSAVWKGNVFGVQFHPEKSQAVGLTILENFAAM